LCSSASPESSWRSSASARAGAQAARAQFRGQARGSGRITALAADLVEQVRRDERHDEIRPAFGAQAQLLDGDDVRVVYLSEQARLAHKALAPVGLAVGLARAAALVLQIEQLYRDARAQIGIEAGVHGRVGRRDDLRAHAVLADLRHARCHDSAGISSFPA